MDAGVFQEGIELSFELHAFSLVMVSMTAPSLLVHVARVVSQDAESLLNLTISKQVEDLLVSSKPFVPG
jgi:hypothetical protein